MSTEPTEASTPPDVVSPDVTRVVTVAVAVVGGFAATAGQVHPTGYAAWDVTLVGLLAAAVIWLSATSPWWAPSLVAIAAGATVARHAELTLIVLAGVALALALLTLKLRLTVLTATSVALSIAVLCRLRRGPFFGATAVFGLGLVVALVVVGLAYQAPKVRLRTLIVGGVLTLFMVVGGVGFGLAAYRSQDSLSAGNAAARSGITALKTGDFAKAATLFQTAGDDFARAEHNLDTPWARLGRVVPVVAQNRTEAVRLVRAAHRVADTAHTAVAQINPEALRLKGGSIDIAAVTALARPVAALHTALIDLQSTIDEPMSPWVPAKLSAKLTAVHDDLVKYRRQIDNLDLAVRAAPGMLGATAPRSYFLEFSTPAETRSIGGFIGNYAVLTIDKGAISLTGFGRSDDLRLAAPPGGMTIKMPADFVRRYGAFDFKSAANGLVAPLAWKNIGIGPDFPTTTAIVQQMYQATFHKKIDGAILIDPYPLAKLLSYTGPQTVAGYPTPIDANNAVDFILRKQYLVLGHDERVDLLDVLAHQTLAALLGGALPSPMDLAKDLGPYTHDHRLMMWTDQPDEQKMLDAVGVSGRFPPANGRADFGITFNNAAPNKVDAYLTHTTAVSERVDPDLGPVLDVTLDLTNTVQPAGMPLYVTGNTSELPVGTAYLYLSIYGPGDVAGATRDGESLGVDGNAELGLKVAATYIDLEPGQSTQITFTFEKSDAPHAGPWRVFVAPTAQRDPPNGP